MFNKSLAAFSRQDDMCNVARLYLSQYILSLPEKSEKSLSLAGEFATLDHCPIEENIYTFLSGDTIAPEKLEQPYKAYALFEKNGDPQILIKAGQDSSLNDYTRTRLLRYAAKALIKTDLNTAENILLEAKKIDRYNGWSLAIHQDLILLREVCLKKNQDCTSYDKRIALLESILRNN